VAQFRVFGPSPPLPRNSQTHHPTTTTTSSTPLDNVSMPLSTPFFNGMPELSTCSSFLGIQAPNPPPSRVYEHTTPQPPSPHKHHPATFPNHPPLTFPMARAQLSHCHLVSGFCPNPLLPLAFASVLFYDHHCLICTTLPTSFTTPPSPHPFVSVSAPKTEFGFCLFRPLSLNFLISFSQLYSCRATLLTN